MFYSDFFLTIGFGDKIGYIHIYIYVYNMLLYIYIYVYIRYTNNTPLSFKYVYHKQEFGDVGVQRAVYWDVDD